jgi:adenosine/AMP kinase/predicted GIY-YIG superfamily endonuclease
MAFYCYILECADGSYYTGWTTDPQRREKQHNRGLGARYTRTHRPVRLVYIEPQTDRTGAMRRELAIKKLTHSQKAALASGAALKQKQSRQEEKMEFVTVKIEKPENINFILGQAHFIKTVEDLHETLVNSVPGIKFGVAFCEASGLCLVRWSGTDPDMIELAKKNALAIGCGHSFVIFLGDGFYPLNVLNAVKNVAEVANVFCATANETQVVIADLGNSRGIMGVVEGEKPKGIESDKDIAWRKDFLRKIGYKAG